MQKTSQDSRLLPSELWAICQEATYLSLLLMGVKSDKTMLSEVTFTLVTGVRQRVPHLFTTAASKLGTQTGVHNQSHVHVAILLSRAGRTTIRKLAGCLSMPSCLTHVIYLMRTALFLGSDVGIYFWHPQTPKI